MNSKWWTLAVVAAGTYMSALDGSVVNTALPVIGREAQVALPVLEWVILAYLLTVTATLLVFGRLADIFGQRCFYLSGLVLFTAGSLLCGLAPGIAALIGFRALQALGASMLFALGPAVLTATFPAQERGRALGMQATVTYLGLSTGPALGGFLTHHLGWRSIFFVNVPIGSLVIVAAFAAVPRGAPGRRQRFDALGAGILALFMASLLFALSEGHSLGWVSPPVAAALMVCPVALAAFLVLERRLADPTLDLSLFANRAFSAAGLAAFLSYTSSSAVSLLMPFYLIQGCGYRVDTVGLILISTSVTMALLASPAGWLSDHIGARLPATVGMTLAILAILLLRGLGAGASSGAVVWRLALLGAGMGLFTSPNNSALMGSAPPRQRGVAGAILAAARNLGFGVGVATAGLIYSLRLHQLGPMLPPAQAVTAAMHDATTGVALLATPGILASALRGAPIRGMAVQPEQVAGDG
ncbi:MAG TPA: DHA2 family efflux MFS transporter permease subunit [Armatimonadota bacterium]|jgi:EmrB/QacA subfamily drug resistance transporter